MKKFCLTSLFLFVTFLSFGQRKNLSNPEPYFSAIIVNDIERSITWYTKNFGLKVLNKTVSQERGFKQANLTSKGLLIELIEINASAQPNKLLEKYPKKTKIDGFFKFGFLVSNFDKWVTQLKLNEVKFNGSVVTDNLTGKKMLLINDPDGNRIQLFEK